MEIWPRFVIDTPSFPNPGWSAIARPFDYRREVASAARCVPATYDAERETFAVCLPARVPA